MRLKSIPKTFGIDFFNGLCRYIFEVPLGVKRLLPAKGLGELKVQFK
jgi:hypothetical protein